MTNCIDCTIGECNLAGKIKRDSKECKYFNPRSLNRFEKKIVRQGIICGLILGFLLAISITWPLWGNLP